MKKYPPFAIRTGIAASICALTIGCAPLTQINPLGKTEPLGETFVRPTASAFFGQPAADNNLGYLYGLTTPMNPTTYGTKLLVADSLHHRVLIWNTIPTSPSQSADVYVGQKTFYFTHANGNLDDPNDATQAAGLNTPNAVCVTSTGKMIVTDKGNHRVLIWNSIPTTNGTAADVVLGQPDFTSNTVNNGGISAQSMNSPTEIDCSTTRLYVTDFANHRVLFWNTVPTVSHTPADGVLGQTSFGTATVNQPSRSLSTMNSPRGVAVVGTRLLVADASNHRILVWNTTTPASLAPADSVLGQSATNTATINNGGLSGHSMSQPIGIARYGSGFAVTESGNNRVLVWNSFPGAWTTDADFVLGQPNLTTGTANTGGISDSRMTTPVGLVVSGSTLIVADQNNNRLLIYNPVPTTTSAPANYVWGQPNFLLNRAGGGGSPLTTTNRPFAFFYDQTHFWVTDSRNNRALRFPAGHTPFDGSAPDLTLGQASLATSANSLTSTGMSGPVYAASNGTKYYISDSGHHRILIWTSAPTTSGQAANAVLGQSNFTTGTSNAGGLSATSLSTPYGMSISGTKLFVTDYSNNRVLIWNTLPNAQGDAPDVVLGQATFGTNTANFGGLSASSLLAPSCVLAYGSRLFVCDRGNHRILVWETIPTLNNTPADYVIGQPNFTTNSKQGGQATVNAAGLSGPIHISYEGGKFFVSDFGNHRILVWNSVPTTSGTNADTVYGQFSMSGNARNAGGLSLGSMNGPTQTFLHGSELWVVDDGNNRLLRFDGAN